jgi:ADP-ribose pyrophosphatase
MTDDRRALARLPWRTLGSRPVYVNPWIRVREDIAELPDRRRTLYGVVVCKPALGVLPMLDHDTVVLVGQYRYVFGRFFWEIPTGAGEAGESERDAAARELEEETGYRAGRLEKLGTIQTSKSFLDEIAHLFIGTELAPGTRRLEGDATEFIEVAAFAVDEAIRMVERGEIQDAMSVVALLHAARRRRA